MGYADEPVAELDPCGFGLRVDLDDDSQERRFLGHGVTGHRLQLGVPRFGFARGVLVGGHVAVCCSVSSGVVAQPRIGIRGLRGDLFPQIVVCVVADELLEGSGEGLFAFEGFPADGTAVAAAAIVGEQAVADGLVRCTLEIDVEGRLDAQPRIQDEVAFEALEEEAAHLFGEVAGDAEVVEVGVALDDRRDVDLAVVDLLRDVAVVEHAVQDVSAAIVRGGEVAARVVATRALDQAGKHRGFGDGQALRVLPEVGTRGLADAPGAAAEIDLVQIEIEDLVLAEVLFDLPREDDLAHLAAIGPLGGEQEALHHLLGDGRGAARDALGEEVVDRGARDRDEIDPLVLEEGAVLGGHEGELDVARDLVDRDEPALLGVVLTDQLAIAVVDLAYDGRVIVVEAVEVGQVADQPDVDRQRADRCSSGHDREHHEGDPDPPGPEKSHGNSRVCRT